eukprot:1896595-Prymnesium_polylepis.1
MLMTHSGYSMPEVEMVRGVWPTWKCSFSSRHALANVTFWSCRLPGCAVVRSTCSRTPACGSELFGRSLEGKGRCEERLSCRHWRSYGNCLRSNCSAKTPRILILYRLWPSLSRDDRSSRSKTVSRFRKCRRGAHSSGVTAALCHVATIQTSHMNVCRTVSRSLSDTTFARTCRSTFSSRIFLDAGGGGASAAVPALSASGSTTLSGELAPANAEERRENIPPEGAVDPDSDGSGTIGGKAGDGAVMTE